MPFMKKIFLLCCILYASGLQAQQLNPVEQKIVDAVNKKIAYAEALLQESVDINSGTLNISGVKKVGEIGRAHV